MPQALAPLDEYWTAAVRFVETHSKKRDRILAPSVLKAHLSRPISDYTHAESDIDSEPWTWALIHKGQLAKLTLRLIHQIEAQLIPVFANEVFVVFAPPSTLKPLAYDDGHLRSFRQRKLEVFTAEPGNSSTLAAPQLNQLIQANRATQRTLRALSRKVERLERQSSVYLGQETALTQTAYGHKMIVPTQDISLAPHILLGGVWEPWVSQVFMDHIEPGMTVLDIGANLGYYTLLAASLVGETGHVYGFEVNTDLCDVIQRSLSINGFDQRTTIVNKAVYSSDTVLQFNRLEHFQGSSSVREHASDQANQALQQFIGDRYHDSVDIMTVEAIALDTYFADPKTKIDFIKIDTEGSEPYIFQGMKRLLEQQDHLKVVFEFYPITFKDKGEDAEAFLTQIESWGLTLNGVDPKNGVIDTSIAQLMEGKIHEVFAVKL